MNTIAYQTITKSTVYYPMTISYILPYVISKLPLPVILTRVDRVASTIYPL